MFTVLIFISIPVLICATTLQNFPIAKPGCDDKCGDVNIPYPFGKTENCYRNSSFLVTCNQTYNPPQLFLQNSNVRVTEISLTGQLKVMIFIGKTCYSSDGIIVVNNGTSFYLSFLFTVNNTANKFTVIGCDSYGYLNGYRLRDRFYSTGCIALCSAREDIEDGSCKGIGCCQTSGIPEHISSANVTAYSFNNNTSVSNISNCTYAFLVEEKAFKFSRDNLTSLWNVQRLPVVVDWVVANETCALGKMNSSSYGCVSSSSTCLEPIGGDGYICQCDYGYEGNPYLIDGCKDSNECDFPELNNCSRGAKCENYPGGFKCNCPKGYRGSGMGAGGCTPHTFTLIAGIVLGIILVIVLVICLLYMVRERRRSTKMKDMFFHQNGGKLLQDKLKASGRRGFSPDDDPMAKIYSSKDLEIATKNFHRSMIVGQGGFGTVYKGELEDKRLVAIKKSKEVDPNQIEQFINEFFVLSRINHRNVVKLLGCCLETEVPHLVYEFIDNGTLYDHIHNQEKKQRLDWSLRLKIATETADVLGYLHSTASTPIIHRDVKSSNILLDKEFKAKVSDFGGSRLVPMDQTQLPTVVLGTLGYLDPEYIQTQQLTEKSDVYSFGVVLVELITGRKAINYDKPDNEKCLANYFISKQKEGLLIDILDETIVWHERSEKQVSGVAKIAQMCLNVRGEDRPSMKEVAVELEGLKTSKRRSWTDLEQNSVEIGSYSGKGFDGFVDVDGYNTSMSYDSVRRDTILSGGR